MTIEFKSILIGLILVILIFPRESIGEDVYKWKSEDGSLHFSNYLPQDNQDGKDKIDENKLTNFFHTSNNNSNEKEAFTNIHLKNLVNSIFTIKNGKNLGTGFFISPKGYALTCRHIIEENREHIAVLGNHKNYPVGIIATSDESDLALILVIAPFDTPFLIIRNSDTLKPDEQVYTAGTSLDLKTNIANGRFKGFRIREDTGDRVLQFSAPVDPGNSGSPLMDSEGRVIGIVSWKILSQKGAPVFGVGFAVPSDCILEEYGTFRGLHQSLVYYTKASTP